MCREASPRQAPPPALLIVTLERGEIKVPHQRCCDIAGGMDQEKSHKVRRVGQYLLMDVIGEGSYGKVTQELGATTHTLCTGARRRCNLQCCKWRGITITECPETWAAGRHQEAINGTGQKGESS